MASKKEKVCFVYESGGNCRFGDKCRFLHTKGTKAVEGKAKIAVNESKQISQPPQPQGSYIAALLGDSSKTYQDQLQREKLETQSKVVPQTHKQPNRQPNKQPKQQPPKAVSPQPQLKPKEPNKQTNSPTPQESKVSPDESLLSNYPRMSNSLESTYFSISGEIPSLLHMCRIALLQNPYFRKDLNEYYEPYFKDHWENYVSKNPYEINQMVLYYSAFPQVRETFSFFQLFKFIENFEVAYLAKSKEKEVEPFVPLNGDEPYEDKHLGFFEPKPEVLETPLINVWKEYSTFVLEPFTKLEKDTINKVHFVDEPFRPKSDSCFYHSINDKQQFLKQFHLFTNNQFQKFTSWNNMVIIGGAIVASAMPVPPRYSNDIQKYYNEISHPDSDIDIYIYGLDETGFKKKLKEIYAYLQSIHPKVIVVSTPFTVTLCTQYPNRHIQIVIGKWKSIAEVLLEPDIDCTCIAFDGKNLWTTQRARVTTGELSTAPPELTD
eukprot:TRINITY_DN7855_c0_g2_i3.p1 TRINITY_DN7855_c0_g2~~TRINITY_DN7855_c0_g2_i3.p1  ORF type:complete len:504 (-),score=128.60 TRINITY_DN7855_c0_g2_i3:1300-2775(-)